MFYLLFKSTKQQSTIMSSLNKKTFSSLLKGLHYEKLNERLV